jgi:hypothetical protein
MPEERVSKISENLLCSVPVDYKSKDCTNIASFVCHDCNIPLCGKCAQLSDDRDFVKYKNSGGFFVFSIGFLFFGLILTILGINLLEWFLPVYISGIIIGISGISRISYNLESSGSIPKLSFYTNDYTSASHCKRCYSKHSFQKTIEKCISVVGLLIILIGIYYVGNNPYSLILISFGIAAIILSKEIVGKYVT